VGLRHYTTDREPLQHVGPVLQTVQAHDRPGPNFIRPACCFPLGVRSSGASVGKRIARKIRRLSPSRTGSLFLLSAEEEPWPDTMLPMAVHPTTTPALSPRARVSPHRPPISSLADPSSSPCHRIVSFKSRRLPLRSLHIAAAAAAGAEEEEAQLGGSVNAVDEEEAEVMAFRTQ
jgi:hypothetical protein